MRLGPGLSPVIPRIRALGNLRGPAPRPAYPLHGCRLRLPTPAPRLAALPHRLAEAPCGWLLAATAEEHAAGSSSKKAASARGGPPPPQLTPRVGGPRPRHRRLLQQSGSKVGGGDAVSPAFFSCPDLRKELRRNTVASSSLGAWYPTTANCPGNLFSSLPPSC